MELFVILSNLYVKVHSEFHLFEAGGKLNFNDCLGQLVDRLVSLGFVRSKTQKETPADGDCALHGKFALAAILDGLLNLTETATTLLGVYTRIAGGTFLTEEVGVNVPVFLAYYEETHFNGSGNYQAIEPVRSSDMLEDVKTMFLPDQGFE